MIPPSIMDTCDLFCNEDQIISQDEKYQDLLIPTRPSIQTLLDYSPPEIINTPDDAPMTSFDDLYLSPQVSSYLQYLKEPSSLSTLVDRWPLMQNMPEVDDANSLLLYNNSFQQQTMPQQQQQQQPYQQYQHLNPQTNEWLYDPAECYFSDEQRPSIDSSICEDSFPDFLDSSAGMSREYVSLSDVNSFVAEADSQKNTSSAHLTYPPPDNLQLFNNDVQHQQYQRQTYGFSSYASVPASLAQLDSDAESNGSSSGLLRSALLRSKSSYRIDDGWDGFHGNNKKKRPSFKRHNKVLKRSAESISTLLSRQRLSSDAEDDEEYEDEEDEDDMSFRLSDPTAAPSNIRKGRNVDKACNHCKRSHLRCDNMRPCRRCIATGKTGCKDVEHKPRGRPRLNKNQNNVKKDSSSITM
ncbi:hypothetical protein BX666DRAFT_1957571 [Dichotomocladium elegans]|nr:hypothetical protein BX666DRAFT_1957571 [Dichotomocladium elegans]